MPSKTYKIGTRGSLLALTQCTQVKEELERLTGDKFELEIIKTQGDVIQDRPLWQLEGKDFFTKELDAALLTGDVDLVVHSFKDLGSERPEGIKLAAITKRDYAHDILLIRNEVKENLTNLSELIVGTSSPRRIVNIESFLKDYIPSKEDLTVKTKMLRGNVNTRIGKLKNKEYDAIVLALPGLERLALSEDSTKELIPLLEELDFMILPQSAFPSAASQGALGIECLEARSDDGELLTKLKMMEHKDTVSEVTRERTAFSSYGGGCHLAVGINVRKKGDYYIHTHKGMVDENEVSVSMTEGVSETFSGDKSKVFLGLPTSSDGYAVDTMILKEPVRAELSELTGDIYVTSKYTMDSLKTAPKSCSILAAGTRTHRQLADLGYWVRANADGLGEDYLQKLRESKVVALMIGKQRDLNVLTNKDSTSKYGKVIEAYKRVMQEVSEDKEKELQACDIFFWTSANQYKTYVDKFPSIKDKYHCCGLGKTHELLKDQNVSPRVFGGMTEFKNWLKDK